MSIMLMKQKQQQQKNAGYVNVGEPFSNKSGDI